MLRIREIRKAKGLTLEQLAEMAGLSRPYLSQIESGKRQANTRRLDAIARALGVTTQELFADTRSAQEQTLLEMFRQMTPEQQQTWLSFLKTTLAEK